MKQRIVLWTMAALLCTAFVAGCASGGSDPFGSSASSGGGGGGGAAGTVQIKVLSNGVMGGYNGNTPTAAVGTMGGLGAGPADPLTGGGVSTSVSGFYSAAVAVPPTAAISYPAQYVVAFSTTTSAQPSYGTMSTWTLEFDIQMVSLTDVDNVAVYWGNGQCAHNYNLSTAQLTAALAGFTHIVVTPSQWIGFGGCGLTSASPVQGVFSIGVTESVAGGGAPGFYIDNVRWVR